MTEHAVIMSGLSDRTLRKNWVKKFDVVDDVRRGPLASQARRHIADKLWARAIMARVARLFRLGRGTGLVWQGLRCSAGEEGDLRAKWQRSASSSPDVVPQAAWCRTGQWGCSFHVSSGQPARRCFSTAPPLASTLISEVPAFFSRSTPTSCRSLLARWC